MTRDEPTPLCYVSFSPISAILSMRRIKKMSLWNAPLRRLLHLAIAAFLVAGSPASAEDGHKPIFNGKDLSGWKIHGTEKWYVDEASGDLICESGPDREYGYLATDKQYKDFELILEFKQESDGNSGVFFRSSLEGTKISGWQAEVAPPGSDTGGIYESYKRGWLIKPDAEAQKALKFKEWNEMKLRVVGGKVTTWLNGQQMITLDDEEIGKAVGQIALQIHSGNDVKIRWRNLRIKEL
jgi:hypothetical protein